jgi:hypothetical protein
MKFLVLAILFLLSEQKSRQPQYRGCFFKTAHAASGSIKTKYTLFSLPPNDPLYNVTVAEIIRIQGCFGVFPIFFFYDDRDGNNAMATDEVVQQNGPDGTVIFGRRLFNREFIKTYGGTTIPIIMAHEYAHIVDYKYGALQHAGSKRTELFADFLAGFYMYHRVANGIKTDVDACIRSFESLGDTDFGSETHHGTAEERADALTSGFNKARDYHQNQSFIPLTTIIDAGKEYIATIEENETDVKVIK